MEIHNVYFTAWDTAGYWDDDYIPFSYFVGSDNRHPLVVNGQRLT